MTTIIFDFNRTLYDPDTGTLVPGAFSVLEHLRTSGAMLHLISKLEPGREDVLKTLGIYDFFISVTFTLQKNPALFQQIMERYTADPNHTYVIGDRILEEIRSGNKVGARTIWYRRGRFKDEEPQTEEEVPWRIIKDLSEIPSLIE